MIAIGDVQGCHGALQALLEQIPDNESLWFAGDLVNRGPESLHTLRLVRSLGSRATVVLGNHDLHLLAVYARIRKPHRSDTLDDILKAPDRLDLIDWLRTRPLAVHQDDHLLVHAGLYPQWSATAARAYAAEVEHVLASERWTDFLARMYGNSPDRWHDGVDGTDRLRIIVNALTRMRFLAPDGSQDFRLKQGAESAPTGYRPWFDWPDRASADTTIVFGHWSTLGLIQRPRLLALDTGCVWGGCLTGIRLGDREIFQVRCRPAQVPDVRK